MSKAAKKSSEIQAKRERELQEERARWQQEFVARQDFIAHQMEHRKKLRQVPKPAWIFMAAWGGVLGIAVLLFIMSFNPATKGFVQKIIGSFKIF
jgi:hypothetical protein